MHATNSALATATPDIRALREEAINAGAMDPMILRFRIVEFDKSSGEQLGIPVDDIGFCDAVTRTAHLIEAKEESRFCLEPVGFIQ